MQSTAKFHFPVAVHLARGSIKTLGALVGDRRACLVISPHLLGTIGELLGRAGLTRTSTTLVAPSSNPSVDDLRAINQAWSRLSSESEAVVAIGGGSTIDFAKALAASGGDLGALLTNLGGDEAPMPLAKPFLAVPTTAGTGSEVTSWATIWDPANHAKLSLHNASCWAEAAVVDPELLEGCPHEVALASGLDALSHALESVWNHNANPISDALALDAACGIIANLPCWLSTRDDVARDAVSKSALLAGMAFSQTKTALAHALSYDITLTHGTLHGIACSFSLPEIWRRAVLSAPGRMEILSPIFGTLSSQPLSDFLEALGVDTNFNHYGVDDIDAAVSAQLSSPRGRNFIGAPIHG